ncbi:MAG: 2-hydroxyacyl-CoA dehydratase [Ruminococcaceae bacterium]|nr:2-hydroxyacyl-CoA dehydratase [Oscillospiraceae bacterium]
MADLNTRLKEAQDVAANPKKMMAQYLKAGKKVVGCMAMYTPEPIVHASGMIPMGLWGGQVEQKVVKTYMPAFACPIMQSCLELGLRGSYEGLSAAVIPTLCDVFRCVTQDWNVAIDIPVIPLTYPQHRQLEESIAFLVSELETVKGKLEKICGHAITDDAINASIDLYNQHAAAMRTFAKVANDHLDVITPEVRHAVFKSALFMERGEHLALMNDIIEGLKALPVYKHTGKKVVLTGITAEPDDFLAALSGNGVAVVADDLGQEMRQYRTEMPAGANPLERIARQWQNRTGDPLAHSPTNERGEMLVEMVKENGADGVIVCLMKFCDPEEYDFPLIHGSLKEAGVPTLSLDIDQQPNKYEQAKNRVQAFVEML